jgi:hypothetical protein
MEVNSEFLIGSISAVDKKTNPVKIVLPIISCLLLLACIVFVWMYKYRGIQISSCFRHITLVQELRKRVDVLINKQMGKEEKPEETDARIH